MAGQVLINFLILLTLIAVLFGALELEVQCWRLDRAHLSTTLMLLPGSILFTLITLALACIVFQCNACTRHALRAEKVGAAHPDH